MKNSILISCIVTVFLFSCDKNDDGNKENLPAPISIELSSQEVQMTQSGHNAAMNLFSIIHEQQSGDENIIFSPLSLNMALAMVWNGAGSETKQVIQNTMGMDDYSPAEVNAYFRKLRETFVKTDPSVRLALANSIWYRLDLPVKEAFIQTNKTEYDAEVSAVDFSDPRTLSIINQWCSRHTNGLISEMIKEIPGNAVMYLLNALYFKGNWADKCGFNSSATADAPFTKEDGSKTTVKMMQQNNTLRYYQDEYLALTALPYGNGAFSMLFVLPQPGVSFEAMTIQLKQNGYWEQCLRSVEAYDVDLYIPRFKTEYEITLNDVLKQAGMGIAFTKSADFSEISDASLCISQVKQKSYIEVNEEGTEAAAVTSI
ncbi:MAG: serpin family protein, partial [Dysgonamonadaceae bacterium]|nr:serpin family protein [Dysgonamonadaceae bacterium]